jgi:DNA repair ATPase RecN
VTAVEHLEGEQREREIAGMLGALTDTTWASAREMLAASQKGKQATNGT